ncbi:VQ motif-containing protein 22-like [Andrographis paniculata]|uniref:VQ motif-containing protein 22-like n=1 Tax=Andrographis paniculata TaxID=175694 RepID=UPI0021E8F3F7|nr:VQ motif-containing protein 22-like [Andrographis paniculata]
MAISQTMTNSSSDWLLPVYQTDFTTAVQIGTPGTIAAVSSSTTTIAAAARSSLTPADHVHVHGRISKPIRRRSRASRRTPTTLLNTDATNFRAMVQQFTGGPAARFAAPHLPGGGTGSMFGFAVPPATAPTAGGGFHVAQYPNQYGMDGVNRGDLSEQSAEETIRTDYANYMMLR